MIEEHFGYFPSFHDDVIEKIEISSEGIRIIIEMQNFPEGMTIFPKIIFMFYEVEKFNLKGEIFGCASIIFDMQFKGVDGYIETEIYSSLGTCGTISSKKVQVQLQ